MAYSWSKDARRFLARIERLAADLELDWVRDRGPLGIIEYQRDIATLQRDIQRAIRTIKKDKRSTKQKRGEIDELGYLLVRARDLGDAFAWIVLAHKDKVIVPLTENKRVPVAADEDDGSRGVFAMAETLMRGGWGIPIVHDITDCLRIGDLTFVSAVRKGRKREFVHRTVEVKTHRISAVPKKDGTQTLNYQATVIANEPMPQEWVDAVTANAPETPLANRQQWRDDRRLEKQMQRMDVAVHKRTAKDDSVTTLNGMPYVSVSAEVGHTDWRAVRRAIRDARKTGFAAMPQTPFVTWLFFFSADGIGPENIETPGVSEAAQELVNNAPNGKDNSITVLSVPPDDDKQDAPRSRPFWLWDVPKRARLDILRRRVEILALVNTAGLESVLEERGYRVEHARRDRRSFEIVKDLEWPDGTRGEIHLPTPWNDIIDAVQNFTGLSGIVPKVESVTRLSAIPVEELASAAADRRNDEDGRVD